MTIFLSPLEYEWTINLVLADPDLCDELDVPWNPATGTRGRDEAVFALACLNMFSEDHRALIETERVAA